MSFHLSILQKSHKIVDDHSDMTIVVYWDVEQQPKSLKIPSKTANIFNVLFPYDKLMESCHSNTSKCPPIIKKDNFSEANVINMHVNGLITAAASRFFNI